MKELFLLASLLSAFTLYAVEGTKAPDLTKLRLLDNTNKYIDSDDLTGKDLIDNDEFMVLKEENGCKIVVFHEKTGTGFVDKSMCLDNEEKEAL